MKTNNWIGVFLIFIPLLTISCTRQSDQSDNDVFFSWDSNSDNRVDGDEFSSALEENDFYEIWDVDNDGVLNEEEWSEGILTYYSEAGYDGDFRLWDLNSDRYVDFEEYTEKTFEIWDADNNGYIDAEEYRISYYEEDTEN